MKRSNGFARAIPFVATFLLLAVCTMLPMVFLPDLDLEPSTEAVSDADAKAQLFTLYTDEQLQRTALDEDELTNESVFNAASIFSTVQRGLVVDQGSESVERLSGSDSFVLEQDGQSARIIEMYREWNGDWHNWLRMWIDADTGVIYRCYYSANVLQNAENYMDNWQQLLTDNWNSLMGEMGFVDQQYVENGASTAAVTLTDADGVNYDYDVKLLSYTDEAPSLLIDLDIRLAGVEET